MPLSAVVYSAVAVRLSGSPDLGTSQFESNPQPKFLELPPGTGPGLISKPFIDTRTLTASASEDLDLSGALLDPLNAAAVFAVVKVIEVEAAQGNTNNVVMGGAASNAFVGPFVDATDKISIPPGGKAQFVHPGAGWTVTAGTGDLLHFANSGSGTSVTFNVKILG